MIDLEMIIVEDDPLYQSIYVDALRGFGAHLTFCNSVQLAASLFELISPDVIIVDLGLPDGDGVDAIARVRDNSDPHKPYIVVVTSSDDAHRHQQALNAGASKVLIKPIDAEEFQTVLRSLSES